MIKMINCIGVNIYIFTGFYIKSHKKISQKFAESKKSSTFASQLRNALLAQLVEQLTLNQWVQGSSP